MFLGLSARIRARILYALVRSLVLFATLISTQLINAIFKNRTLLEKWRPKGGFLFFYIYADVDQGKEVEKVYLPLLAT